MYSHIIWLFYNYVVIYYWPKLIMKYGLIVLYKWIMNKVTCKSAYVIVNSLDVWTTRFFMEINVLKVVIKHHIWCRNLRPILWPFSHLVEKSCHQLVDGWKTYNRPFNGQKIVIYVYLNEISKKNKIPNRLCIMNDEMKTNQKLGNL
jgi:hypothetical protein